jgi:hypothetical protein
MTPPQFALFIVAYALTCLLVAQEIANVFTADSHYALAPEEDAPTVGRVGVVKVIHVHWHNGASHRTAA